MSGELTLKAFFRRYFLAFLGGVFAAYFSLAFAVALSFVTYLQNVPLADSGLYIFLAGAALTLLVVHSNFMIVRGRPRWVWMVVGGLVACLLFVLPMIQYTPPESFMCWPCCPLYWGCFFSIATDNEKCAASWWIFAMSESA